MPQDSGPTRFFAFGLPKSGTTWLQMLLHAHPDVYCPAEDDLLGLYGVIQQVVKEYQGILDEVDRRTARQGARKLDDSDAIGWFRAIVLRLWGEGSPATGINENSVAFNFQLFSDLFPEAKFIQIIRDPRAIAVSSWDHNLNVEGSAFISRAHSLDDWCEQTAQWWIDNVHKDGDRMISVQYRDMLADTVGQAARLFSFLGVDPAQAGKCADATRFDKLKAAQPDNPFFRAGQVGAWKDRLDSDQVASIIRIAGDKMLCRGYEDEND